MLRIAVLLCRAKVSVFDLKLTSQNLGKLMAIVRWQVSSLEQSPSPWARHHLRTHASSLLPLKRDLKRLCPGSHPT